VVIGPSYLGGILDEVARPGVGSDMSTLTSDNTKHDEQRYHGQGKDDDDDDDDDAHRVTWCNRTKEKTREDSRCGQGGLEWTVVMMRTSLEGPLHFLFPGYQNQFAFGPHGLIL
jgi:hypothetical protein